MKKAIYISFLLLTAILSACSSDDATTDDHTNEVAMPVFLSIPASDVVPTRAGDPGAPDTLKLPTKAYIYIVCKDATTGKDIVVHTFFNLNEGSWEKTHLSNGDSAYQYKGDIHIYLPINRGPVGKIYAALSTVDLPGLPTNDRGRSNDTEETVQNYKYHITDDVNKELVNIYSTPYNNRPDGSNYYGTVEKFNEPAIALQNLVLYHIASRLDLQWNVDQSIQSTTAIKTLTLSLPTADSSYIFKPKETVPSETLKRTERIITTVGTQWYGRQYTYVIPMTDSNSAYTFGATATMTDGSTRTNNNITTEDVINKSEPFAPWMRGFITVR